LIGCRTIPVSEAVSKPRSLTSGEAGRGFAPVTRSRRFEERFVLDAERVYAGLTPGDREAVDQCIDHILANPEPDGDRIVELRLGSLSARAVLCDELSVLFVIDLGLLWILSIERGIPYG
jgi:hypothetical protein